MTPRGSDTSFLVQQGGFLKTVPHGLLPLMGKGANTLSLFQLKSPSRRMYIFPTGKS